MKTIITHSGSFHSDDIFAVATLALFLEKEGVEYKIIRTRDEEVIEKGDFVVDVGGVYDADKMRFDHHQIEGAGSRMSQSGEVEIPYASFGLVWKHFGDKLCSNEKIVEILDSKIVQPIDAIDSGISISKPIYKNLFPFDFYSIISSFRPSWSEKDFDSDGAFADLVSLAKKILSREIKKTNDEEVGISHIREIYKNSEDKKILILPERYSWGSLLDEMPEVLIVVSPDIDGVRFKAECVRANQSSFDLKIHLPKSWAGLRDEELQKITGVDDAIFCHRNLFLAVASSKEGALKLAQLAILA